ncbi:MAG TPA: isochorismatase family cysteine hydrolase [Gaiellaceae bacterium]|nr:isochorismatase family cysteine hydrolase [Gaiellaceae bacterium]
MNDCLLVVDLFSTFAHENGDALLASLRRRRAGVAGSIAQARADGLPVVYANDTRGVWDGDARGLVEAALEGPGGDVLADLAPRPSDAFVVKPRYSAFDLTPLTLILEELEIERILLMGMATEMCVAQTAIDARERRYRVTVLTGACATVNEEDERLALAYLERIAGVWLVPTLAATPAAR